MSSFSSQNESDAEPKVALRELRIQHQNLQREYDELGAKHHGLKEMFQMIAHDLRSPFNGFLGITDLLVNNFEAYSSDEILEILKTLNRSSNETYIMLENLLEWSNLEVGAFEFHKESILASELISDTVMVLSTMIERKGIEFAVSVPENAAVMVDEAMIGSVLRNLISNGIKFTPEKGAIDVEVREDGDDWLFVVSDSGVGMNAEQVEAVVATHKVESVLGTSGERGSGVGLMLIHQFLEKHQSSLHIESVVGEGTVVSFRLPAAQ
ncbi:MAG: sensor histidine kinase [Opitutaceae bacterium]